MRKKSQLIPSLDGLRAISIGLVIVAHSMNGHPVGVLGVRVFFVISGYLITHLLLKEFNSMGSVNLKRFYFRRTMRIFPPFYFYLLVVAILGTSGIIGFNFRDFIASFTYTSDYFFPVSDQVTSGSWFVLHSWSLAVEEQFYLLYPPLLVILRKKKIVAVLVFILFLAPVLRIVGFHLFPGSQVAILYGFHANMDALASGCLLAFAAEYERFQNFLRKITDLPQLAIIALAVLIFFANYQIQGEHPTFGLSVCVTFMNTATALIIYWSIANSETTFIGRMLNTKALSYIGALSYSLYLWQQLFTGKEMLGYFPLNLLAAFICALISFYTVEKYSLKLRAYLEQRKLNKQLFPVS